MRVAMKEVMSAIHRVDNPAAVAFSAEVTGFFADNIKLWVATVENFNNRTFGH